MALTSVGSIPRSDVRPRVARHRKLYRATVLCAVVFLLLGGCQREEHGLHDHDHYVPPHWPTGPQDAAAKMDERLPVGGRTTKSEVADRELRELINWAPEIAADAGQAEAGWNEIWKLCQELQRELEPDEMSVAAREKVVRLSQLLKAVAPVNEVPNPVSEPDQ